LYLAQHTIRGSEHYFIKESYKDGDCFRSRRLVSLGMNPARYIVYPGGNAFYIDGIVEEELSSVGTEANTDEIEDVFWPFIRPDIRRVVEWSRERAAGRQRKRRMTQEEEEEIRRQATDFDRRRILYLRCGQTSQCKIGGTPVKLLKWLAGKSRDEIEQCFLAMERCLQPRELKDYTFFIFDLQRFFTESWAKKIPQGLDQERMDRLFLEELCRLSKTPSFWKGELIGDSLQEYLVRYVVMFFDNPFGPDSFLHDYVKEFMDSHRAWRFPEKKHTISLDEASSVFGVEKEILGTMGKRSLIRLFRRMAQQLHPDKGGTHDEFVKLNQAYRELLRRKRAS
jgi:hypothetical protein